MSERPEKLSRRDLLRGTLAMGAAAAAESVLPRVAQGSEEKEFTARDHFEWWTRELKNCNSDVAHVLGHGCGKPRPLSHDKIERVLRSMSLISADTSMPIFPSVKVDELRGPLFFRNSATGPLVGNATRLQVRDPRTGKLQSVQISARHVIENLSPEHQSQWIHDPQYDLSVRVLPDGESGGVHFNLDLTEKDIFGRYGVVHGTDNPIGRDKEIQNKDYGSVVVGANSQILNTLFPGGTQFHEKHTYANATYGHGAQLITLPESEVQVPLTDVPVTAQRSETIGMSGSGFYVYDEREESFQFAGVFFSARNTHFSNNYSAPIGFVCGPEQVSNAIRHALSVREQVVPKTIQTSHTRPASKGK